MELDLLVMKDTQKNKMVRPLRFWLFLKVHEIFLQLDLNSLKWSKTDKKYIHKYITDKFKFLRRKKNCCGFPNAYCSLLLGEMEKRGLLIS